MNSFSRIWILGASRGIGAAIARALPDHQIVLSARSEPDLQHLAASLNPSQALVVPCDVSNPESLREAYSRIHHAHGGIDVLVYSAGIGTFAPILELSASELDRHMDVNVRGLFTTLQLVLPAMIAQGRGHIININSVAVLEPFANCSVYGASKAAARAMLRSVRTEVRTSGITITDVYVGATDTAIWPPEARTEHASRMMTAEAVARTITSLIDTSTSPGVHLEEVILRPPGGDL
jgi:3-oxoacyl-[acyl-carrier protein] reductase